MDAQKSLYESLADWLSFLGVEIRAALTVGIESENDSNGREGSVDPDFHGWLVSDPMVTLNPTSRYGDDATGFLDDCGFGGRHFDVTQDGVTPSRSALS